MPQHSFTPIQFNHTIDLTILMMYFQSGQIIWRLTF